MLVVLTIIVAILGFSTVPIATVLGFLGFWAFDLWSAIAGVAIGLVIQFRKKIL